MTIQYDKADEQLLAGFNWREVEVSPGKVYALAQRGKLYIYMHRLVIGAGPGEHVDHINGDGLDNRLANLRIATRSQNSANRPGDNRKNGKTSKYKGVSWNQERQRWRAYLHYQGKTRALGAFLDEEEAARAYNIAARQVWGEFARQNPVPEKAVSKGGSRP